MGPKKRALSQPSGSGQSKNIRYSNTQPNIQDSFRKIITNEELNNLANDCVRFVIYRAGHQLPFRKNDLQKHIKGAVGTNFDKVLKIASTTLEKIYGFQLIVCDGGTKFYIVSNKLPHIEEDQDTTELSELPNDRRKILLMLILVHLFMSKTSVSQASLYSFLKSLHIEPEARNEIFGDVKDYINSTLVKQHYLTIEKDTVSQEISYLWGERAEKEISKMDLLQFVCKVFKTNNPKAWATQFKEAEEQPIENHRTNTEEVNNELQ